MNHYVYEITNLINGKKYIGKRSCNCDIEKDKYMGSGNAISKAIDKYGVCNFKKEIICICDNEERAYQEERKWIAINNANNDRKYYNISEGGNGFTSSDVKKYWYNNREKYLKKIRERNNKKVILINNGKIFESCKEASKYVNLKSNTNITMCCKGERSHAGTYNNKKAVWMYYEDYIKLTPLEINYIKNKANEVKDQYKNRKVICLNNMKVFNSCKEASKYAGLKSGSAISDALKRETGTTGRYKDSKLKWMYYDEYLKSLNGKNKG